MDEVQRREATLREGLESERFVEALLFLIRERREIRERVLHKDMKDNLSEHSLRLLMNNGACAELLAFEEKIQSIHDSTKEES